MDSISSMSLIDPTYYSMVIDAKHCIIEYNQLLKSILSQNILGQKVSDVFIAWKPSPCNRLIYAEYEGRKFIFIKSKIKDDTYKQLHGLETDSLGIILKENEKLKTINNELNAIIENSYDGIYITDKHGVTLRTNSAIERITGIPKEYYIGKNVNALMKRGILKNSVAKKVLKYKRMVSMVQKNYLGNETILTGSPVYNEKGEIDKVVTNIRDLSDLNELQAELAKTNKLNDKYKKELQRLKNDPYHQKNIITQSKQMRLIYETANRIANIDATVLILGETGVGKDVLANFIFSNSNRAIEAETIKVNCGAIPPELLESELFGYEGGAFTGANRKGKQGMFELADKGILFLDEIGELPLSLQVKLLRVLQEGEIQRVGGTNRKKVDVRVIAATNRDLREMVKKGEFREDLYYRINVIPIDIPPLRERRNEILPLIQFYLSKFNEKYDLNREINHDLKNYFYSYDWPGNIRELSNLIERLVVTSPEKKITMEFLPSEYRNEEFEITKKIASLKDTVELAEKKVLRLAAKKYDNTYDIAKALKSSQPTIVRRLKKYNINI